jgi:hypothetical protein
MFKGKMIKKTDEGRFWARVDIRGKDECWEWQAGKNSTNPKTNYGIFYLSGIGSILAHRLALSFHLKRLVSAEEVRHQCDNPPCCNPYHLLPGTHTDNMQDKSKRNRCNSPKGIKHPGAKLTDDKVRRIRKLFRLQEKYKKYKIMYLARMFKVDSALIRRIIDKTSWSHVED